MLVGQLLFIEYLRLRENFHDTYALQMTKKRASSQQSSLAAAQASRWTRQTPDQETTPAPINSGAEPPLLPRSAAFMHPVPRRCTRTGHCSRSRCFGRRDGDCWKSRHSTSASPTSPTSREATAAAPPPPDFLHRCARHARTHAQLAADCAVGQAAAATSDAPIALTLQQHATQVWLLSACRCTRPAHAHAHARPAFDPAAAVRVAVQRCRNG